MLQQNNEKLSLFTILGTISGSLFQSEFPFFDLFHPTEKEM